MTKPIQHNVSSRDTLLARAVRAALAASEKVVNIQIDTNDLSGLKAAGYKLCFAKKIATEEYNVIWQSYSDYLADNTFSWTPQYELFGTRVFKDNITVRISTNVVSIGLGEESVLNPAGVLLPAKTGGPTTAITMQNQFGSIHPGVNQISTGLDGKTISTPIYVAANPIVQGDVSLTPVEKVLVWFEQNVETSMMFSAARSMKVEIDLTSTNSATRLYKDQKWITPGP